MMNDWYSVESLLPEPYEDVLLYGPETPFSTVCHRIGFYDEDDSCWLLRGEWDDSSIFKPTHWQKLTTPKGVSL